jgi:hypothetical protein
MSFIPSFRLFTCSLVEIWWLKTVLVSKIRRKKEKKNRKEKTARARDVSKMVVTWWPEWR